MPHYILDAQKLPTPVGVVGELYIGGIGVGRGYRNRPDLTAERFIADPFASAAGARMYKTGDMCRFRPDGVIDYLGRADHQVKIRGFRVELGEVESNLLKQPGVRGAVVIAQERGNGQVRLVAFVAADAGVTSASLSAALRVALPDYMVPSNFVVMPRFPITFNGKVDRKALPMPEWGQTESQYVAPANDIERDLADVFAKVLRIPKVGASDNFFQLGGDSLSAVSLAVHFQKRFGKPLTLADLFRAPTVAELARAAGDAGVKDSSSMMILRKTGTKAPLFCLPGAGGSSFSYRSLVDGLPEDRAVYAYNLPSLEQRPKPLNTIRDYALDVLRQIREIHPEGPFHILGYSFGGTVAFELAQVLAERGETLASLGIIDSWGPGYPYKPPFFERCMLHLDKLIRAKNPTGYFGGRLLNQYWRVLRRYNAARRYVFNRLNVRPTGKQAIKDISDMAIAALSTYEPRPLNCCVDFYHADVPPRDWPGCIFADPCNGWRPFLTVEPRIIKLPCEHDGIFESGISTLTPAVVAQLNDGDETLSKK
jgi:thioesterase domain-containing protein/acyl carrier protein